MFFLKWERWNLLGLLMIDRQINEANKIADNWVASKVPPRHCKNLKCMNLNIYWNIKNTISIIKQRINIKIICFFNVQCEYLIVVKD